MKYKRSCYVEYYIIGDQRTQPIFETNSLKKHLIITGITCNATFLCLNFIQYEVKKLT